MNIIDALALLVAASSHVQTLAGIIQTARADGRDELTPQELAKVRSITLESETRLEAASS